jgi:sugar lactone lactonase YvrE
MKTTRFAGAVLALCLLGAFARALDIGIVGAVKTEGAAHAKKVLATEIISAPRAPTGTVSVLAGVVDTFATDGAVSSLGDPVDYRFDFGDGTVSPWVLGRSTDHVFTASGTCKVTAQARCRTHPAVTAVSGGLSVTVLRSIVTVGGDGTASDAGDGGPVSKAEFSGVWGVAIDAAGNVYVCDPNYGGGGGVRKIDTSGIISRFAAGHTGGFGGDGGPATAAAAKMMFPGGICTDAAGNVYVADAGNNCIRKIDTSGNLGTIVNQSTKSGYTGDFGFAISAQLYNPQGVAVDPAGNLYIADTYNDVIREVDALGSITTAVGTGTTGYSGDGGLATKAELNGPEAIACDAAGNLYISDWTNHVVRKVDLTHKISTVAGNGSAGNSGDGGPATSATLDGPWGLAVDRRGNLYIVDNTSNVIRMVDTHGIISTVAGTGLAGWNGDGQASTSLLKVPWSVACDAAGAVYITDHDNVRLRKLSP